MILWVAFCLAMPFLLAGKPNRLHIAAGSVLFMLGIFGVLIFLNIWGKPVNPHFSIVTICPAKTFADILSRNRCCTSS